MDLIKGNKINAFETRCYRRMVRISWTSHITNIDVPPTKVALSGPHNERQSIRALRCWGQPSIYFPIGDPVNVSRFRSHTNGSGVITTSHNVASHIMKLLLSFRHILQFRFRGNPQGRIPRVKWSKQSNFCRCAMAMLLPPKRPLCCEAATKKLTSRLRQCYCC